ncbi:hypothetical protein HII36_51900, partial [Nonomuraea sp. NN258]|uniref:HEAT repeat domain-containing protein n=1 Tax=Nonomuraea antri TaxID=2730852 RepID=UPI001F438B95
GGWVPPVEGGQAGRWSPSQRDSVRARLADLVADDRLAVSTRIAAIRATARVGGGVELLAAWASREETVLAEAAITALAGVDRPARALPVLLAHGGGGSSRVAVAALARCCPAVPPSVLGPLLEHALTDPGGKVTLRKLAVRQLARNRPPGAVDVLLRAWAEPDVHPDVRVTLAAALRAMPEDPRTLDALADAAERPASEQLLRTLFQAVPLEYVASARPRYADLIRRLLPAAGPPAVRSHGARAFATWARWYRGDLTEIVEAVADPGTDGRLTDAFLALVRSGAVRGHTLGVLSRLAAAVPDDDPRGPARKRVNDIVRCLDPVRDVPEPWQREPARNALDLLADHPLLLPQAVRVAVSLLPAPGQELAGDADGFADEFADGLCELADLLRDRPVLAAGTAAELIADLFCDQGERAPLRPAAALPAARRLAARGDQAAAWLALTLTRVGGEDSNWAPPWAGLLRALRACPHPEVSTQAWDVTIG